LVWVVAIEPLAKVILVGIRIISFVKKTMLVVDRFLKALVIEYGKHPPTTDMVVEHGTHKLLDF
jgi:hypothetical protein